MTTAITTLAAGTWTADPVHSDISFRVRHMGVGRVRGTFDLASAALTVDDRGVPGGRVTAVADATSVRTGSDQRDAHVRSADFLDVATHPRIEFASTEVCDVDGDTFTLVGELTLHGVTRTVELEAEFHGVVADPSGAERAGFTAVTTVSRAAFGIDIRLAFGTGQVVVVDAIEITIEIEFLLDGSGVR